MATFYPGAVQRIISRNHGGRRALTEAVVLHVDAGGANTLFGWFSNPASSASSHFYVKYDGTIEQYLDADLIAWTQRAGNTRCIGIETQGVGSGSWTEAQLASLTALVGWLCDRYSLPKASMGNSRKGSRGIGIHRFGIDPWRVNGGEVWGGRGKACPGDARVGQFPGLVARIAGGAAPVSSPAPAPATPAPSGPIRDGRVVQLQHALRSNPDGYWGPDTNKRGAALRSASGWGGGQFPYGVAYTQSVVGATPDGVWGPKSRAAHDATTAAVQRAIGTNPDGIWGPQSEAAYQSLRTQVRGQG